MRDFKNSASDAAASAAEAIDEAKETGREAFQRAQEETREFASKGLAYAEEAGESLSEFARRQPWVALAGAFLVGYLAARVLRRLSF